MENTILVEKFLSEEFGLSKREINLYLNLTKYGATTILELSEISNINRVTTHVNIENLTQKGLVTQIKKGRGSRRLIMAEPVEKLYVILQERKAKLNAAADQLGFIITQISGLKKEHKSQRSMEISRYEGKEEIKLIYADVLCAKEIRSYLNYKELIKIFPANTNKFLETQKKRPEMQMWEIMEDSEESREYVKVTHSERYHYKLTGKNSHLGSFDYMIFDGKVAVIDLAKGLHVNAVVIEDETFYHNARTMHQFVWHLLPPY